jgi:BolA protein
LISADYIESHLRQHLDPTYIEVLDESAAHSGHAEAKRSGGGHFSVIVVSEQFSGKSKVARHRMIYDLFREEMAQQIHALAITAWTPEEYRQLAN